MVSRGEVHLVRRIVGYKKIRYYTHENVGYGHIDLPDQEMHTTAVWWQVNPAALDAAFASRQQALDGFLIHQHPKPRQAPGQQTLFVQPAPGRSITVHSP